MMNTTYVTVTPSGPLPHIHIRQFNAERPHDGQIQINPDGVILSLDEFSTFVFHLRAIEDRLVLKSHTDPKPEPADVATQTSPSPIVVTIDDYVQNPIDDRINISSTTNMFDLPFDFGDCGLAGDPPTSTNQIDEPLTTPDVPAAIPARRKRAHQPAALAVPAPPPPPPQPVAVQQKRVCQPSDYISVGIQSRKQKQHAKVLLWYAKRIRQHCIQFGARDCIGCQNNLIDRHNICDLTISELFDRYFDRALAQIDDSVPARELKMKKCPNKFELISTPGWRENVKQEMLTIPFV
jgi:hypothetical protein